MVRICACGSQIKRKRARLCLKCRNTKPTNRILDEEETIEDIEHGLLELDLNDRFNVDLERAPPEATRNDFTNLELDSFLCGISIVTV